MSIFSEYSTVRDLLAQRHAVIVYSESKYYYQYYQFLLNDIRKQTGRDILYITSDKNDPLLKGGIQGMRVVYVKWLIQFLFSKIQGDVMIMTMPDLDNYGFKRSTFVSKYYYLPHAAVSLHQQYTEKAFFHYDAILCAGPFHAEEVGKLKEAYQLKDIEAMPYGYPLFEEISRRYKGKAENREQRPRILVGPSWFSGSIMDTCIEEVMAGLSRLPYDVLVRVHPEYMKRKADRYKHLLKLIAGYENISIDTTINVLDALLNADLLITDRSGIALEYAFGTLRPVLFIETAHKIHNSNWEKTGMEPIENKLRTQMGKVIALNELDRLGAVAQELINNKAAYSSSLDALRNSQFYSNDKIGGTVVQDILRNLKPG
ncbi:MAG: CDP-glycerol glycerophosphotransferase family protein [Pseudobacter sp.]|uniref:CDP-glycerol glycerophosphotransferase family protein n=1 Tax=Pseudobacter sp. TaxID=2045420 RepID=UPI003F821795